MERILESSTATSVRLLRTTPDALRQLASRLELQAKAATLPGQVVTYAATKDLTIVYEPPMGLEQYKRGLMDLDVSPHTTAINMDHPDDVEVGS